ncbi:MAG TPA: 2-(1,2-epoxy-1,2-dihydrophenyl)acetyl-CoA isomerase PaaG [Stellaceae bacterium]|nr:2-(1,2-epoxy-1,2-dihydrophenyl)acetyl-CoA isomerase PaaG [Stellaceae bacterium]
MGFATILFEQGEGVATLTLNRPDRLNSFTAQMHEDVAAALGMVEADAGIRALLITGAGRGFCAGQDLNLREAAAGGEFDAGAALDRYYNPLVRRLKALRKPVIAAVNGPAAGAGANLALACDIVLAARSASFLQAFCRLGLVPDTGGTWFLPRLAGSARAMGMMLLGEPLPAPVAAEWGLIWKVVDDDKLMAEARGLALKLAQGPTIGLGLIKEALNRSLASTLDAQLDSERDLQRIAAKSPDFREGVAAFLEKRPPRFTGQ